MIQYSDVRGKHMKILLTTINVKKSFRVYRDLLGLK